MATRDVFSEEELGRLRGFPEINREELIRYFTLTAADEVFLRKFRGRPNVLGAALQLCALPWLGFVPDDVGSAPPVAVQRLSARLGIAPGVLAAHEPPAARRLIELDPLDDRLVDSQHAPP